MKYNNVQFKYLCAGAPYEEHKHCGDGNVAKKGHEIVLRNLEKEPYRRHADQKRGRDISPPP